jgi:hypothetical protein
MQRDKATESTLAARISSWARKPPMRFWRQSMTSTAWLVTASVGLVLLRARMFVEARA